MAVDKGCVDEKKGHNFVETAKEEKRVEKRKEKTQ